MPSLVPSRLTDAEIAMRLAYHRQILSKSRSRDRLDRSLRLIKALDAERVRRANTKP